MRNSRLFQLLETFDPEDWKSFRGYLQWQTREKSEVILLFNYISPYRENLDHNKLELNIANESIFENKTRKNFLNLLSKLFALATDYIAIQEMRQDQREFNLYKMLAYNHRGLYSQASKQLVKNIDLIESAPLDLWNQYYIQRGYHEMKFSDNNQKPMKAIELFKGILKSWELHQDRIDKYYILDGRHIEIISRIETKELIRPLLLHSKETKDAISHSLLLTIRLLETASQDNASTLLKWLNENQSDLKPNIGSLILLHLVQHHNRILIKNGDFNSEMSRVIKLGMNTGWFLDHGKILSTRFLSFISACSYTSEEYFVEDFVNEFKNCIDSSIREETVIHANAIKSCIYGKHEESMNHLNSSPYSNFSFKGHGRILTIINYYMIYKDQPAFVISTINNTLVFFRRNQKHYTKRWVSAANHFCNMMRMLVEGVDIDIVQKELDETKNVLRRLWMNRYLKQRRLGR